ncbi:GLPGLI family protein [Leeuwenhoekiella marinoflava]|uniref:GLPGLI family protein n=2 Tax=Leeuwenhoekiella marinoflava TaxID=988 RepID=A0A4Q0PL06_9FLAO|nr:GLPGLI family protein [Leeuwenhoekiella marinoflava]RXG29175.1 GLPGLI family protein [Leeuwenhoekiella marinoflava]SHF34077.1 GLPGLI family protein [Leeuwenhoekiella marinoflava DSM 3653]
MRLFILILFISSSVIAQTKPYVKVTYRAKRLVPIDYKKITNSQIRTVLQGKEAILNDLDFKLTACKDTYFFKYVEGLDLNGESRSAASLAGGTDVFYRRDTIHFRQNCSYGECLNITLEKNRFSEWKITDEQKIILGYTCFKAIAYQSKIVNDLSTKQQRIVAWFTPELNFHAGPQGLDELPGLVLEGSVNDLYTFYAKEIVLEDNCKEIEVPEKGKTLTKEEYDQVTIDMLKLIKSRG